MKKPRLKKGFMLIGILVFSSIAMLVMTAIISAAASNLRLTEKIYNRERAFHLTEAGNEYYRWHLAHASQDFKDGTNAPGPYVHTMYDKEGVNIGAFSLNIVQPIVGSTVVRIQSTGSVTTASTSRRIQTTLAIPSLAKYAVATNEAVRFGEGTEVFGPVHSNDGVRFDGLAHNIISSARTSYDDADHTGGVEFAVHTHVISPGNTINDSYRSAEAPPNAVPARPDVFIAGRQFPVPAFDFAGITTDLASMKSQANAAGRYFGTSGGSGYRIVLKTNDTFDLYRVTALHTMSSTCINNSSGGTTVGWGSWSIRATNGQTFLQNYPIPANGLIFVEDNVWVEGQINTARLTIAAGRFPDNASTRPNITVNNDLLYTNHDGRDVISLISQGDVNVGFLSDTNLRIDGALVAQNGRTGRYYYASSCGSTYQRDTLTLYGMLASNKRYGFAYTDGTGYETRSINYDSNLLYGPPPSFPLTSSQYSTISWEEI
jgi:hypothetical protein